MAMLVVAGLAILATALLAVARMPRRGLVADLLAVALVGHALVVADVGVAGLLVRSLAPSTLVGLAVLAFLAAVALARPTRADAGALRAHLRRSVAVARPVVREPVVLVSAVLVAGALAWRAFLALRLPVVDYDGWSYHLVFVDAWIQADALVAVPQRIWTAGYPAATEMTTAFLAAFTRSDALAGFTSLLPIPLAMLGVTGLARQLGVARPWAVLAGLLMAMTPAMIALAGTSYVDNTSVAMVAATWWLGLRAVRGERDAACLALLGIAGGLALGAKGTNGLLVGPVVAVAGVLTLLDAFRAPADRRRRWGAGTARLAALAVPVLAFGASWYLKNLVVYGNPLYPFALGPFPGRTTLSEFELAPKELVRHSFVGQLLDSWTWDWRLPHYAYNQRPGGLGRAWPLVLPLAAIGAALVAARRRLDVLALVALPAVVTLAIMPMPWYARLTLFLPAIALPLAAVTIDRLPAPRFLASAASFPLAGVAIVSLVLAAGPPNIPIHEEVPDATRVAGYLRYVLEPDDARRAAVSLRAECAGFAVIPPGDRFAAGGFNLLHAVVGPNMDRILGTTVEDARTPAELLATMRADGDRWLVTHVDTPTDRLASEGGLVDHGVICQDGRLWELRSSP